MGLTPSYGAGDEKPLQNADFAMKQTNICRLSGDIITVSNGAITSKIKHAIKLKTSPARLAQLLQPSLAFCFSLQPMTALWTVRRHWLQAKTKC